MLSSISPLGERAKGNRYGVTAAAHIVGGITGGALVGALAGGLGALVFAEMDAGVRLIVAAAILTIAGVSELGLLPSPPTSRRQVDEDWLVRYRGWVYGVGFGFQLGLGYATIVTTTALPALLALLALGASPSLGALVGAVFGAVRTGVLLANRRVRSTDQLLALHRRVASRAAPVRRATAVLLVVLGAALLTAGVVG